MVLLHLHYNGLPFKVPRRKKSKTPLSPIPTQYKFRLFRFRSPLLTESYTQNSREVEFLRPKPKDWLPREINVQYFLFLWLLRCFTSPGCSLCVYEFNAWFLIKSEGFPHSEISGSKVAYHLPEAYRRLLRPSSPNSVKASTVYSLHYRSTQWCFLTRYHSIK